MSQRFILSQMLLPVALFVAGCTVPPEPIWLGNSSGFIVPRADGSVVHYDLEKKATRQLAEPTAVRPVRVAVSPGDRLAAIAVAGWGPESRAVGIKIVRLADGSEETVKMQEWGDPQAARKAQPTGAFWCPTGNRILISYTAGPEKMFADLFAVYDVRTKRLAEMSAPPPAVALAAALNVSPIAPDGSGYLVLNLDHDEAPLGFVDWNGWQHAIQTTPELREKLSDLNRKNMSDDEKTRTMFPLRQGQWTGNDLTFPTRHGLVRVSLEQRRVSLEPLPASEQRLWQALSAYEPKDGSWFAYQIVRFREGPLAILCDARLQGAALQLRIELIDAQDSRRRVLLEGGLANAVIRPLTPSPNGKYVLAWLVQEGKGTIHVIRYDGTVTAQVETGRVPTK